MNWAILELYCGESGKLGFYNSQELGLARALASRGIDVTIVYPTRQIESCLEEKTEERIVILRMPCKTVGVHAFYNLDFLLERKIDVVHLDSDNQIYAPHVMKFCRKHHIFFYNYMGTIYSDTDNYLKKIFMQLVSDRNIFYYRKSPVVAKTTDVRERLEEKGVKNVKVIPVGLDLKQIRKDDRKKEEVREELGLPDNKKILLFVGRLENYKRPFAALKLLKNLGEAYHLIVIGNGSLKEELKKKLLQENLENKVSYFEKVPNTEMYQYYHACDYYVNFNTHEIFGMSILEAMYQRCIVVARRAPGPQEIIEDKISGYLCDSDEDMERIIRSEEDKNVRERAEERILLQFSWEKSADRFIQLVEDRRKQI